MTAVTAEVRAELGRLARVLIHEADNCQDSGAAHLAEGRDVWADEAFNLADTKATAAELIRSLFAADEIVAGGEGDGPHRYSTTDPTAPPPATPHEVTT